MDDRWFPWKPQFVEINKIPLFTPVYQQILSFQWFQLVYHARYVSAYATLPFSTRCHGNEKIKIPRLLKTKESSASCRWLSVRNDSGPALYSWRSPL